ncbi:LuxR C-terminal-related transcriptional regulator [Paenibacillus sp.]|uniref:LuxR C-terminal-related transcriptional regulator n=1 Tax=Paenibacillus sp. TaxID=58172 RepID=UPI002810F1A0|nr:LuxR C-terminal-related transcriptional regulator [Paenibacillus sp.]
MHVMTTPIVSTKLYAPEPRANAVSRPRLLERLNEGARRKLTLICASAGSGKTTLVGEWLAGCSMPAAWVSLDEGDNEPSRFLTYVVAALQTIVPHLGQGAFGLLRSPQPPPPDYVISVLLNELDSVPGKFILVFDDYHVIDAEPVEQAVAYLVERMPPRMHVVIAAREEPRLPVARLRVRDQLTEVRAADLRFTPVETESFLNEVMGLRLSKEAVAALDQRTEGWIAGLQLAALSVMGRSDAERSAFSFSGGEPYVTDYLLEEVLQRQPASVQRFLLYTSVLDRFTGSLCDAVLHGGCGESGLTFESGQDVLTYLERSNLFLVPLDRENTWYRYHHLFAELLRQRLRRADRSSPEGGARLERRLHESAAAWYEAHDLELEAFRHATAAEDIDRAARLAEGKGMPLPFRGAVAPVLDWLGSLPEEALDARPSFRVMHASALLLTGNTSEIEPKLQAAEAALRKMPPDDAVRDHIGHIASIRATLAVSQHQSAKILAESRRALEHLHPNNLPVRTATTWALGHAYQLQGKRAEAEAAYAEAFAVSERIGHVAIAVMAGTGLGNVQEAGNLLFAAADTYRRVLALAGDPPLPAACEAHLGLARVCCEWNDLAAAERHGAEAVRLARHLEHTDREAAIEVFLAKLKLARGDWGEAAAMLAAAERIARQRDYALLLPGIAAARALALLRQGNPEAAERLMQQGEPSLVLVRIRLAQGRTAEAMADAELLRGRAEAMGWEDERLQATILLALALQAGGEREPARRALADALAQAEPGGFVRVFADEGAPMRRLLRDAAAQGVMPSYASKLLAHFEAPERAEGKPFRSAETLAEPLAVPLAVPLFEPLSEREIEVLRLIAEGRSNREIGERLFLALSTVKGHNRIIFDKLQVERRTEAVARARELGLL